MELNNGQTTLDEQVNSLMDNSDVSFDFSTLDTTNEVVDNNNDDEEEPPVASKTKNKTKSISKPPSVKNPTIPLPKGEDVFTEMVKGMGKSGREKAFNDIFRTTLGTDNNNVEDYKRDPLKEIYDKAIINNSYIDSKGNKQSLKESSYGKSGYDSKIFGYDGLRYLVPSNDNDGNFFNWISNQYDPDINYQGLVPYVDPDTGETSLKEVTGKLGDIKKVYSNINKYGIADQSDGILKSIGKGFINTVMQTDDVLFGAAKNIYDLGKIGQSSPDDNMFVAGAKSLAGAAYMSFGGKSLQFLVDNTIGAKKFDELYNTNREYSQANSYISSKEAENAGSADWFGQGFGNVAGSLVQFGAVGKGIRVGAKVLAIGLEGATGLLGVGRLSNALNFSTNATKLGSAYAKQQALSNVTGWGTSAIVGMGYGYNGAKEAGLSDRDAAIYGTITGTLSAAIEQKIGNNSLAEWLTGGGGKSVISKQLLREIGQVNESSINSAIGKYIPKYIDDAINFTTKKAASRDLVAGAKSVLENSTEEALQATVEQAGQYIYDHFGGYGKEVGKGRFSTRADGGKAVKDILTEGFFGGLGAVPFAFNQTKHQTLDLIRQGKTNDLLTALGGLYASEKINKTQYDFIKNELNTLDHVNKNYSTTLKQIVEVANNKAEISDELINLVSQKLSLADEVKKKPESISNVTDQIVEVEGLTGDAAKEERKKRVDPIINDIQQKSSQLRDVNDQLNLYNDPSHIKARDSFFELQKQVSDSNDDNSNVAMTVESFPTALVDKNEINHRKEQFPDRPLFYYAKEAQFILDNLNEFNPSEVKKAFEDTELYLLPQFSQDPRNRQKLIDIGIDPSALPLDDNEKALNPNWREDLLSSDDMKKGNFSYDQSNDLIGIFNPSQQQAFKELTGFLGTPIVIRVGNSADKITGEYNTKDSVLSLNFDNNKISFPDYQNEVFNTSVHELTHALYSGYLKNIHQDYFDAIVDTKSANASAQQYLKIVSLAELAFEKTQNHETYFKTVFLPYQALKEEFVNGNRDKAFLKKYANASLSMVNEFFAEALGNPNFQALLDGVKLEDDSNYVQTYGKSEYGRNSIMSEIYRILSSVYSALQGMMSSSDHTLLKESFGVAATMNTIVFSKPDLEPVIPSPGQTTLSNMSISDFGPKVIIGPDNDNGVDDKIWSLPDDLLPNGNELDIVYMLNSRSKEVIFKQSNDNDVSNNVKSFIRTQIMPDYKANSMEVMNFENSNLVLLSYRKNNDTQQRVFLNRFGRVVNINTNVFDKTSPIDMTKTSPFHINRNVFDMSDTDYYNSYEASRLRKQINNFDKANKDNFSGKFSLIANEGHTFLLRGQTIAGGVDVLYTDSTGKSYVIGYVHDLAKIPLSKLLLDGANISLKVDKIGKGTSYAKITRDKETNEIVAVATLKKNEEFKTIDTDEYIVQKELNLFPSLSFTYGEVTGISNNETENQEKVTTKNAFLDEISTITSMAEYNPNSVIAERMYDEEAIKETYIFDSVLPKTGIETSLDVIDEKVKFAYQKAFRNVKKSLFWYDLSFDRAVNDISGLLDAFLNDLQNSVATEQERDYIARLRYQIQSTLVLDSKGNPINDNGIQRLVTVEQIKNLYNEYESSGHKTQRQDWNGYGLNPNSTISQKIVADIETITFYNEKGLPEILSFDEGKQVMFDASIGSKNFDEMVNNIEAISVDNSQSERKRGIAKSMHYYYTKKARTQKEISVLESAKNSFWSQFASYVTTNSIVFEKNGDAVNVKYANQGDDARLEKEYIISTLNDFVEKIRDNEQKEYFNNAPQYQLASGQTVSVTSLLNKINNTNINDLNDEEYDLTASQLISYMKYLGIDVPPVLLERNGEVRYVNTEFTRKNNSIENKKGKYPAIELVAQLSFFINRTINNKFEKNTEPDFGKFDNTIKKLANLLTTSYGNNETPEIWRDVNFNLRYSRRVKSFKDDIFEELSYDKARLNELLNTPSYSTNRVLQQIKEDGELKVADVSGISVKGNEAVNTNYENASDIDTMYMYVSGWNMSSKDNKYYFHIDETPSDKPTIKAYQVKKILPTEYSNAIEQIKKSESNLFDIAESRFNKVFLEIEKDKFIIKNLDAFNELTSTYHYKMAKDSTGSQLKNKEGKGIYVRGNFNGKKDYFYGSNNVSDILDKIDKEARKAFKELTSKGLTIPVANSFANVSDPSIEIAKNDEIISNLYSTIRVAFDDYEAKAIKAQIIVYQTKNKKLREITELQKGEYQEKLKKEQEKIFTDFYYNWTINRFSLSQIKQGNALAYKDMVDLSKRQAGSSAPGMKGVWEKAKFNLITLNDFESGETTTLLPVIEEDTEGYYVSTKTQSITSNRTDAQGYVTEQFAEEIMQAYGDFSDYEKIFKPVVFGVTDINEALSIYLKTSTVVLPDPYNPKNTSYYNDFPSQYLFAKKVYDAKADMVVFESGVKSGLKNVNNYESDSYTTQKVPTSLFRLQNDPSHTIDDFNNVSSGVQMEKQLADNHPENFQAMLPYYKQVADFLQERTNELFSLGGRLSNADNVKDFTKQELSKQLHTQILADGIDNKVRIDNPVIKDLIENLVNSAIYKTVSSPKRRGEQLVNVSDFGFKRPEQFTEEEKGWMFEILGILPERSGDLKYIGPRRVSELSRAQIKELLNPLLLDNPLFNLILSDEVDRNRYLNDYKESTGQPNFTINNVLDKLSLIDVKIPTDKNGYILDEAGNTRIFPADLIVPFANKYKIGDKLIANRIPSSGKNSMLAGEIIGILPDTMGNTIVSPAVAPGIFGFDFDVDKLFVYERTREEDYQKLFDAQWGILTSTRNYNELTTPISTDTVKELTKTFTGNKVDYSRWSIMQQIAFKNLNSIGKKMIGIVARNYGTWSKFNQTGVSLKSSETKNRYYNNDGNEVRDYVVTDSNGRPVYENFMELLNAATDNAKLQYLGKLNLSIENSNVATDMVMRGFPLEHIVYFLNQPAIKEFVSLKTQQKSAVFSGEKTNDKALFEKIKEQFSHKAREVDSEYVFKPYISLGDTKPLSLDDLKEMYDFFNTGEVTTGIVDNNELIKNYYDSQIAALEKFVYYQELSQITGNAGKLVALASAYPTSMMELIKTYDTINDSKKSISVDLLLNQDQYYAHHYDTLEKSVDFYKSQNVYASLWDEIHKKIAQYAPTKVQNKIEDDLYVYILSSDPRLKKTILKKDYSAFTFVHKSGELINKLKAENPDNKFLRLLKVDLVSLSGKDFEQRTKKPTLVSTNGVANIEGKELEEVRQAFNQLPDQYEFSDGNFVNAKDLLMAHLLYSKGFGLGGTSFSRLLPVEYVRSFDNSIDSFSQSLIPYRFIKSNLSSDIVNEFENIVNDKYSLVDVFMSIAGNEKMDDLRESILSETMSSLDENILSEVKSVAKKLSEMFDSNSGEKIKKSIYLFKRQALLNNPSLIKGINDNVLDKYLQSGLLINKFGMTEILANENTKEIVSNLSKNVIVKIQDVYYEVKRIVIPPEEGKKKPTLAGVRLYPININANKFVRDYDMTSMVEMDEAIKLKEEKAAIIQEPLPETDVEPFDTRLFVSDYDTLNQSYEYVMGLPSFANNQDISTELKEGDLFVTTGFFGKKIVKKSLAQYVGINEKGKVLGNKVSFDIFIEKLRGIEKKLELRDAPDNLFTKEQIIQSILCK